MKRAIGKLKQSGFMKKLSTKELHFEQRFSYAGYVLYYYICFSGYFDWWWVTEVLRAGAYYVTAYGLLVPLTWWVRTEKATLSIISFWFIWVLINIPLMLPIALLYMLPSPRPPGETVKILYANVFTKNRNYQSFAQLVDSFDPDLVLVAEVDQEWVDALSTKIAQGEYPYRDERARADNFGIAIYSKCPLHKAGEFDVFIRPFVAVKRVECDGRLPFLFQGVHLIPPFGSFSLSTDLKVIEALNTNAKLTGVPRLVVGDLNSTEHGLLYRSIAHGLGDLRQGHGWSGTWNAKSPFIRLALDHALGSPILYATSFQVGSDIGSDHFPLMIEIGIPKSVVVE